MVRFLSWGLLLHHGPRVEFDRLRTLAAPQGDTRFNPCGPVNAWHARSGSACIRSNENESNAMPHNQRDKKNPQLVHRVKVCRRAQSVA
jgi:hypothetical protein